MGKKLKALAGGEGQRQLASTIRDSAQQIWLAGLGAFAKTQEEGAKVFEALVKEGKVLESRTRRLAEAKMSQVSGRWDKAAGQATARATATWDKLEQVFEGRVARALHRLGVPTNRDVQQLSKRVEALTAGVQRLSGARRPRAAAHKTRTRAKH
jgi:poly(hydroxyalkanoate) granule-associated protein